MKIDMSMPYTHLRFALSQAAHGRNQLSEALDLARARGCGPNWIAAIEKALAHSDETLRQVANIVSGIRSPGVPTVELASVDDEALRQKEEG